MLEVRSQCGPEAARTRAPVPPIVMAQVVVLIDGLDEGTRRSSSREGQEEEGEDVAEALSNSLLRCLIEKLVIVPNMRFIVTTRCATGSCGCPEPA